MSKVLAALTTCMAIFLSMPSLAAPPAEWGFQKLPQAMEAAQASNKPVFVLFGFETCGNCKRLYSQTLGDEDLRKAFQKSFVLAYVDTEGHGEPDAYTLGEDLLNHGDLLARFKGSPTPSWVFLTPQGVRLHGDRGGRTMARELLRDADIALEKLKSAAGS
jgi:thioredoxin-related protein